MEDKATSDDGGTLRRDLVRTACRGAFKGPGFKCKFPHRHCRHDSPSACKLIIDAVDGLIKARAFNADFQPREVVVEDDGQPEFKPSEKNAARVWALYKPGVNGPMSGDVVFGEGNRVFLTRAEAREYQQASRRSYRLARVEFQIVKLEG